MSIKNDYTDINYEHEILDEKIASEVFRNYILDKKESGDKKPKKKTIDNYKFLYEQLPKVKQRAVNNVIRNLLSTDLLKKNFGLYFAELLKETEMSTYSLASILCQKYECEALLGSENENNDAWGIGDLRSKLESFKKSSNPQGNSLVLLNDICSVLSVDLDVLDMGVGKRYRLHYVRIEEILQEKNMDKEQFYTQLVAEYMDFCQNCKESGACTESVQKGVIAFKEADKKELGKFIASKLKVDKDEIVVSETIYMEPDNFLLEKYFSKLKVQEQRVVEQLICDLHIIEASSE